MKGFRRNGVVHLSLTDQGQGFPAGMVGSAPRPFVTTKVRGLGLGLSIAERLLLRFGAWMEIANTPEGGGCITLVLMGGQSEDRFQA